MPYVHRGVPKASLTENYNMSRRVPKVCAAKSSFVVVGLLLAAMTIMVGCQGFSSSKPAGQQALVGGLVLSSSSVDFGSVVAGTSKTVTVTASNTSAASVSVSSVSISSKYFTLSAPSLPAAIAPGGSITVSLIFTPNAAGAFSATVSITSNASNGSSTLSLSGTGTANGQLVINPSSQSFGTVTIGSQSSQVVTLTNNTTSTVNISQASVSGSGFQLSGITTPLALNAGQNTTFTVTFAPQSAGSATGSVTITSDAPNPSLTITLSGMGATPGVLGANPTSLDFGTVKVGGNQALSETLTNSGGTSVTISQVGNWHRVRAERNLCPGDYWRRTKHNFHGDSHSSGSWQLQWSDHDHLQRDESDIDHFSHGYRDDCDRRIDCHAIDVGGWERGRRGQWDRFGKS